MYLPHESTPAVWARPRAAAPRNGFCLRRRFSQSNTIMPIHFGDASIPPEVMLSTEFQMRMRGSDSATRPSNASAVFERGKRESYFKPDLVA